MKKYSVNELSKIADVSIRTLHHYDKIGLLKPAVRTEKMYRLYGKKELLRLKQILFYKDFGFSLMEILDLLNDRNFELLQALEEHKHSLNLEKERISILMNTIEETILKIKGKKMITDKDLYKGFSNNEKVNRRENALNKFGKVKVEASEKYLRSQSKEQFDKLKIEQKELLNNLLKLSKEPSDCEIVQLEIAKHYQNTRKFWGTNGDLKTQKKQYVGLGNLYVDDRSYIQKQVDENPDFPIFLVNAIKHYAKTQL